MAGKPIARARNSGGTRRAQKATKKSGQELSRAASIDELAVYDDLFSGVLHSLKEDIRNGLDAVAIAKKYSTLAQARVVTTALTDEDSGKALAASQDILNRAYGKATERKEIKHALADSSEEELDAVIASKMALLEEGDEDESQD